MNSPVAALHATRRVAVAIPVKDEEERIAACVSALAAQPGAPPFTVVLLLNNCTDRTASIVRALPPLNRIRLVVEQCDLPPERAHAGEARRLAMARGLECCGPDGILLTTDADGRAPPDWVACNLEAVRQGADAIAGRAVIDPEEARLIPARLHEDDARECAYAALLDHIDALLDPDPADRWPRHDEHSGASIAVTADAYRRCGGVPSQRIGEDRALFDALRRVDARIRHAPEVWVQVSGRIVGRAAGGMADTIRRRLSAPDDLIDDRLEPVMDAVRRGRLRRRLRMICRGDSALDDAVAAALGLPVAEIAELLASGGFGNTWMELERRSPVLRRRRVAAIELSWQTAAACRIRDELAAVLAAGLNREFPLEAKSFAVGNT